MSFIYINDSFILINDRGILVRLMPRAEHFQVVYCNFSLANSIHSNFLHKNHRFT